MEKRKMNRVAIGFIILVVMVLVLMFSNSLRRSSRITLPAENSTSGQTDIACRERLLNTGGVPAGAVQPGHPGGAGVERRQRLL